MSNGPVIEGRYLLVGYPGLPARAWARVLHYLHPDGLYRATEPIELDVARGRVIVELLFFDPLTGQRWRVPTSRRGWPQPPGTTG